MYNIKLLNKISKVGLDGFDENYAYSEEMTNEDAILVRSASLHEYDFGENLKAIARAGAGVNNIPLDDCSEKGIVVFNTPGANANAVKELVLCGLFLSSRKIVESIRWIDGLKDDQDIAKTAEKGKSNFVGPEIEGKTLGVIGLGAIGVNVANAAIKLGMKVKGYDPYIGVNAAWALSKHARHAASLEEIYQECDYITIHVPSTKETKGFMNKEAFAQMKTGVRILNFARGDLVNNEDLLANVASGNQARMSKTRLCIINKNVPNILANISKLFADHNLNIENMVNRSRGEYAYTLIDTNDEVRPDIIERIESANGIINVRAIID